MGPGTTLIPVPARGIQLVLGGPDVLGAATRMVGRADQTVLADMFRITHDPMDDALRQAVRRDVGVDVLGDAEMLPEADLSDAVREAATLRVYGQPPLKQHTKGLSIDGGREALAATDVSDKRSRKRLEAAARLTGENAARFDGLQQANRGDDAAMVKSAAERLAERGIYFNEPRAGVRLLGHVPGQLIDAARERLIVATKILDHDETVERLVRAATRSRVDVITHEIPDAALQRLRASGVRVQVLDEDAAKESGNALHGTLIVSDEHGMFSTAYFQDRVLWGSDERQSREMGVVIAADDTQTLRARLEREYDLRP